MSQATLQQPPSKSNSYDEVPYDSHPFAQTHPNRLATVAMLFGLNPPTVSRCRMLELGCAAGGNLIPIGEAYPDAQIVGVDLSGRQVEDGKRIVESLGLTNVDLRHGDITEVDESWGQFDYIVCHGVFSWVPSHVQDRILEICSQRLNPNGVAYISYNTYPGWHMRGMIRDMMRYHADKFNTATMRTRQARALLDFLAKSVKQEGPYHQLLSNELQTLQKQADHYLYHEHLEEVNDPMYFYQFAEKAQSKGLRYLGEARIGTMVLSNFGPDIEKTLRMLATDQIQVEQYMDFLRNRMFRETLLVSARAQPNWTIQPQTLMRTHAASPAAPADNQEVNPADQAQVSYKSPSGMSMATTQPLLKAAMQVMRQNWPVAVPFDELRRQSRELLGGGEQTPQQVAEDQRMLALGLLNCYMGSDLVELYADAPRFVKDVSAKPVASPVARQQAANGQAAVTNRRHEVVRLNDLDRQMLPMLDGEHDRPALIEKLAQITLKGGLNIQKQGTPVTDEAEIREALTGVIEHSLAGVARHALLIG